MILELTVTMKYSIHNRLVTSTLVCILVSVMHNVVESAMTQAGSRSALPETVIEVTDSQPGSITSPGFPHCCRPVKFILKKGVDRKYWKVLFTDLDLPPYSHLLIYGLNDDGSVKVPIDVRYKNGAWSRPVVLYEGNAISIEFQPKISENESDDGEMKNQKASSKYVGFKATYWLDNEPWNVDKPLTVCPRIKNAIEGGVINISDPITVAELPFDVQHHKMYCVWQLKPVPHSDLLVYIRLENLSGKDAFIKIRQGLTSDSPSVHSSASLEYPLTFSSTEGFYIELNKPTNADTFAMSYGVFKAMQSSDNKCTFQADGKPIHGFVCGAEGSDVCIPLENKCNGIRNCPSGYDETREVCAQLAPTQKPLSTVVAPKTASDSYCDRHRCEDGRCETAMMERCLERDCPPFTERCKGTLLCVMKVFEKCPGEERCATLQTKCSDGTCVDLFGRCPSKFGCGEFEKRCENGKCVSLHDRCPEDPCPLYQPFKCDGECHYESVKCDFFIDCSDGQDEEGCGIFHGEEGNKWRRFIFLILVVLLVPFFLFRAYMRYKCGSRSISGECCGWFWEDDAHSAEESRPMNPNEPTVSGNSPGNTRTDPPPVSMTTVVLNNASTYSDNTTINVADNHPNQSFEPDSNAASAEDHTAPPPSYGEVMNNQDIYVPSTEPPPSYTSLSNPEA